MRFGLLTRLAQNTALRLGELVPCGLVHQDRHLGGIEDGIDSIFRLLVPTEIEDTGDRPAVPINDPALQRRIDLAWRRLNDRRSERLPQTALAPRGAHPGP